MVKLHLEVITPEKVVFKDDIDELFAPTLTGQIGILPNHIELLTKLHHGELIIKNNNQKQSIAVFGGFLEISNNKISILADYAIHARDIDISKSEEARNRAKELMQEKLNNSDFAKAESELLRSLLELRIATKHKRHNISNK